MSMKHTASLTREQVFTIAEKYGAFEFGDAQGDKRICFAADVIAAHQRLRDAAPEMLEALNLYLLWCEVEDDHTKADFKQRMQMCRDAEDAARRAVTKATGSTK